MPPSNTLPKTTIFVDADACPVKQEVFRVAARYALPVVVVACMQMRLPDSAGIRLELVEKGPDAVDDWIAERVGRFDIVITGDIPLADRCLKRGASVLGNTGKPFSDDNIGSALATRNLLAELRLAGEIGGGPPPFSKKDRSRFLQGLDAMIQAILRKAD